MGNWGLEIARLARGEDIREVEAYREPKSYSEENTFAKDIRDIDTLEATILTHAESVARRLRRDEIKARVVVLKWRPAQRQAPGPRGYPARSRQITLSEATALKAYLDNTMRGHETAIEQVSLPVPPGIIGCGAVAVGGMTDFYMLSDTPGYDLPIKVWGYLDLCGLPYTPDVETAMVAGAAVPF